MIALNTSIGYYLLPVISILLGAVALVFNKANTLLSNKGLIAFILISSVLIALPGVLTYTGVAFIPVYYRITQIVFLFAGILYAQKINACFTNTNQWFGKGMMLLISLVVLCLGSFLFSLVFNFLGELDYGFIASTCTYTLLIPLFFQWAYSALLSIPSEIYKIWKYNPHYQEDFFSSDTIDRVVVLEVELSKQVADKESIKVKAKAPAHFKFGEWFQLFIHDHNVKYMDSPIHFQYNDRDMHGWIFYTKPSLIKGKKYIDFERTIHENELTDDYITVVCKRVNHLSV